MKLFYYQRKDKINNFGDSLNPWLWPQLLPDRFNEDETTLFVGIGTLLNNLLPQRLPNANKVIIFSTGVGYEKNLSRLDKSWKLYCLRGPLSAQKLGVPNSLAITDGAILVRRLYKPTADKTHRFGFMPHVHHANYGVKLWKEICADIGFNYIDPRWSVEQILSAISCTEILLAEAMHGAIVADALRIPWIPISTSARILAFKWYDWCASIEVKYTPKFIAPVLDSYPPVAQGIRSSICATRYWYNCIKQQPFKSLESLWGDRQKLIATQLTQIARTTPPMLSNEKHIERLTVALEEKLHQLKDDV